MTGKTHHIQIGNSGTWCSWTGTQAGLDIMRKAAGPGGQITCSHSSRAAAQRAAALLRPHFKRGAVKVVPGQCAHG